MPKLDLTNARQIKGTMGEILALKGPGFSWGKPVAFASATGGAVSTITIDGKTYRVHLFTSSGSVMFSGGGMVEYLIVGGGGAGGPDIGGGGAGGGVKFGSRAVSAQAYDVVVGAGGVQNKAVTPATGTAGSPSSCFGVSAAGGGYGETRSAASSAVGGGAGPGGGRRRGERNLSTPSEAGFYGGLGSISIDANNSASAGGAGSNENGQNGQNGMIAGNGGAGVQSSITGDAKYYGGGGGGASFTNTDGTPTRVGSGGAGGIGGGGAGSIVAQYPVAGGPGVDGLGGGGGGGSRGGGDGGKGGSGVVIVRYQIA